MTFDLYGKRHVLSDCGNYRYRLEKRWGDGDVVAFIMHNPSFADDSKSDRTVDRVDAFARRWGYHGWIVGNRFAGGRSPNVSDLDSMPDPVGPDNDAHLEAIAKEASMLIVAWGALPCPAERLYRVVKILRASGKPLHCLGLTLTGAPKHPLARGKAYIPADTKPLLWLGHGVTSTTQIEPISGGAAP